MKIFNLNQYSGHDEMGGELRKRMEAHDPGLPESLWDRISHEMDQREVNRKKRVLWWFSSVAVAALMVGVATTLLYKDAGNDAIAVVSNPPAAGQPQGGMNEGGLTLPNTATNEIFNAPANNTPASVSTAPASGSVISNNTAGASTAASNGTSTATGNGGSQQANTGGTADNSSTTGQTGNDAAGTGTIIQNGNATEKGTDNGSAGNATTTEQSDKGDKPAEPVAANTTGNEQNNDAANGDETKKQLKKDITDKTKFTRWMFGLNYGYEKSMRTYANAGPSYFNRPTAEEHNRFESTANTSSASFDVRFFPLKHVFIKSGITKYNNSEKVQYNLIYKTPLATPPPYGNPWDSVVNGNNITTYSTNNWIQIPLEIGYSYNVTPKIGVYASAGAAYSMLQSYTYNEFQSAYLNAFRPWDNHNSDLYRHNHLTANFNAGVMYSFTSHFGINLSFLYRRVTDNIIDSKITRLSYRPYSYGANAGVYFKF